jgi:hypothetical protein
VELKLSKKERLALQKTYAIVLEDGSRAINVKRRQAKPFFEF